MLTVADLKKSFVAPDGERVDIVDVPEFAVTAGEEVALRGESGSGKTTFLNLIAGILSADSGEIRIDGQTMTGLAEGGRDRLRARKLGYVFQTFNLLQGCACLETVLLGTRFGPGA